MGIIDTAKTIYELAVAGSTVQLRRAVLDLQRECVALEVENRALRERLSALEDRGRGRTLKWDGLVYWSGSGRRRDGPFCPRCWDVDEKEVRLQRFRREDGYERQLEDGLRCPNCRNTFVYQYDRTENAGPPEDTRHE